MRFVVDAQLPPVLAKWLVDHGHQARHLVDLGLLAASDAEIWAHCRVEDAALITKDADFVSIRRNTLSGPAVCWLRIGNVANADLLAWFEHALPQILEALARGETVLEVR